MSSTSEITALESYSADLRLDSFLKSQLSERYARLPGVRAEILYFNPKQRLLEQIAHCGFADTKESMRVRRIPRHLPPKYEEMGICPYSIIRTESVIVPNVHFDRRYKPVLQDDTTKSELVIPLRLGNRVLGVLNLEADVERAFSNDDLMYFEQLSPLLALMIEHETYRRGEEFLQQALASISLASDIDAILGSMLRSLLGFIGAVCGGWVATPLPDGENIADLRIVSAHNASIETGSIHEVGSVPVVQLALQSEEDSRHWSADTETPNLSARASGVNAKFAVIMRSRGRGVVAVTYIESKLPAISERYQKAIVRLNDHVAALLVGLEKRGEIEREKGMKLMLDALRHEVHNANGALGIVIDRFKSAGSPDKPLKSLKGIQGKLLHMHDAVLGFQENPRPMSLQIIAKEAKEIASQQGINLELIGDFSAATKCNLVGLRWIIENMVLNSLKHAGVDARAWLKFERSGERGTLTYWDSGKGIDPAGAKAKLGRQGLGLIGTLCDRFGWSFNLDRNEGGPLCYILMFALWGI